MQTLQEKKNHIHYNKTKTLNFNRTIFLILTMCKSFSTSTNLSERQEKGDS